MKKLFFFFLFTIFSVTAFFSQKTGNIDSLLNVLKTAKDSSRASTLVATASYYAQNGNEEALSYIDELKKYVDNK